MEAAISKINDAIVEFFRSDLQSIDWDYKPFPEKWSKKEVIGHLIDSAQINLQRFTRCTYEENFKWRSNLFGLHGNCTRGHSAHLAQ